MCKIVAAIRVLNGDGGRSDEGFWFWGVPEKRDLEDDEDEEDASCY